MTTTIRAETLSLPMSRLGPPSNLPRFRWQQPTPNRDTPPYLGLSAEESSHGFNWGEDSILPYQVSDDYDRELKPGTTATQPELISHAKNLLAGYKCPTSVDFIEARP